MGWRMEPNEILTWLKIPSFIERLRPIASNHEVTGSEVQGGHWWLDMQPFCFCKPVSI